jgi:hypothetical protein
VGSANHGSTLLLLKEKKKVGINEGHHLYLSLSFNISIYTQQSYMEPENDALFSHWEQKKKKKASSRMESAAEEAEIAIAEVVMGQLILVDLVIINLFSNLIFPF